MRTRRWFSSIFDSAVDKDLKTLSLGSLITNNSFAEDTILNQAHGEFADARRPGSQFLLEAFVDWLAFALPASLSRLLM
jgi:hypothetical protein